MHQQRVFLNKCEIFLQQVTLSIVGHFYFIWKKGRKHVQTSKFFIDHASDQHPVQINQLLTLNLKLYQRGSNQYEEKNTHLYLMQIDNNSQDEIEVWSSQIGIQQYDEENIKRQIEIKGKGSQKQRLTGQVHLSIRRVQVMQLENFHKFSAQIEQSSTQTKTYVKQITSKNQKTLSNQDYLSLINELEDLRYLCEKLKSDRNKAMTVNKQLTQQLNHFKKSLKEEMQRMSEYYQSREEQRVSIFTEAIQNLISTFNDNSEVNKKLLITLLQENEGFQIDIGNLKMFHQQEVEKLKSDFHEELQSIEEANHNLKNKMGEMKHQWQLSKKQCKNLSNQLVQYKKQLQLQQEEHQKTLKELHEVRVRLQKLIEESKIKIQSLEKSNSELKTLSEEQSKKITELTSQDIKNKEDIRELVETNLKHEQTIEVLKQNKNNLEIQVKRLSQQLQQYKKLEQTLRGQREKLNEELYNQSQSYESKIIELNRNHDDRVEQLTIELEKLESDYRNQKLVNQHQEETFAREKELLENDILQLQAEINEKDDEIQRITSKMEEDYLQNNEMRVRLQEAENRNEQLQHYLELKTQQNQNLHRQRDNLMREYDEMIINKEEDNKIELQRLLQQNQQIYSEKLAEAETKLLDEQEQILKMVRDRNQLDLQMQRLKLDEENYVKIISSLRDIVKDYSDFIDEGNKTLENYYFEKNTRPQQKKSNGILGFVSSLAGNAKQQTSQQNLSNILSQSKMFKAEDILQQIVLMGQQSKPESLKDKIENLKHEVDQSKQREQGLLIQVRSLSEEVEIYKQQSHNLQQDVKNLQEMVDGLKKHLESADFKEVEVYQDKIKKQQNQIIDLENMVDNLQREIQELETQIMDHKKQIYSLSETKGKGSLDMDGSSNDFRFGRSKALAQSAKVQETQDKGINSGHQNVSNRKKPEQNVRQPIPLEIGQQSKIEQSIHQQIRHQKHRQKKKSLNLGPQLQKQLSGLSYGEYQPEHKKFTPENHLGQDKQVEKIKPLNLQTDHDFDHRKQLYDTENFSLGLTDNLHQSLRNSQQQIRNLKAFIKGLEKQLRQRELDLNDRNQKLQEMQEKNRQLFNQLSLSQNQVTIKKIKKSDSQEEPNIPQASPPVHVPDPIQKVKEPSKHKQQIQMLPNKSKQLQQELIYQTKRNQELQKQLLSTKNQLQSLQQQLLRIKQKPSKQVQPSKNFNRYGVSADIEKILQQEMEDLQRKIIELTKQSNAYRLEKQTIETEIKILNKRNNEMEKDLKIKQGRVESLQEQNQEVQHKFNKLKYKIENKDEEIGKLQQDKMKLEKNNNQVTQQLAQKQFMYKKMVEEKYRLEAELEKNIDIIASLQKQKNKLEGKLNNQQHDRHQRKGHQSKERQRLEIQLYNLNRKYNQVEGEVSKLKQKLETQEGSFKKEKQELTKMYNNKLVGYHDNIENIKQILDQSEGDIKNLKIENYGLKKQNDDYQISCNSLNKHKEELQNYANSLEVKLQTLQNQKTELEKQHLKTINQLNKIVEQFSEIKNQLEREHLLYLKKTEKLEEYQILNQKYIYEVNSLKARLKQFEDKNSIEEQIMAQKNQLENMNRELSYKCIELSKQMQNNKLLYVYTRQDMERICGEIKDRYQEYIKAQKENIKNQLDCKYGDKLTKFEEEVLKLYNENSQYGRVINNKEQQYSNLLQEFTQLQGLPDKCNALKIQLEAMTMRVKILETEKNALAGQLSNGQQLIRKYERKLEESNHQMQLSTKQIIKYQQKSQKLQGLYSQLEKSSKHQKQELSAAKKQRNDAKEQLEEIKQILKSQILGLQLQNNRIKQREQNMSKQYSQKILKLQRTFKQADLTIKRLESTLKAQEKKLLGEKQRALQLVNQQLQLAKEQNKIFSNSLANLKLENHELGTELANVREQITDDEEIYLMEINKLKNSLKDNEEIYTFNLNSLQEELAVLNRELTEERLNKSKSLQNSRQKDMDLESRLEEKIKRKDLKIEELSTKIIKLEQELAQFPKGSEIQKDKYKAMYLELDRKHRQINQELHKEKQKFHQTSQNYKKQLLDKSHIENRLNIQLEQTQLQMESLRYELQTFKQLYQQLQQEIDKRKNKIHELVTSQEVIEKITSEKDEQIHQLQDEIVEINVSLDISNNRVKKKEEEVESLMDKCKELMSSLTKLETERNQYKVKYEKCKTDIQLESSNKEILMLKQLQQEEITRIKGQYQDQLTRLKQSQRELKTENTKLMAETLELIQWKNQYQEIKNYCENQYGVQLMNLLHQHAKNGPRKKQEINQLQEELEQLRFLYEQKQIDENELKKQNMEMGLQLEDYDFISDQVDTLRKICDKLETEKKVAEFAYEAFIVKLQNILEHETIDDKLKERLQSLTQRDNGSINK